MVGVNLHRDFVLDMQQQSLVLLKNEGDLLPLDKKALRKILITGPLAKETNYMTSRYGPQGLENITVFDGISRFVDGDVEVAYAKGCETRNVGWPDTEIVPTALADDEIKQMDEAVAAAEDCDVIIAVLGEDERCTGESRSRTDLSLPGRQQQLLAKLYATGKPIVLVLINGQPLTINWADRNIPSILEAWFPGQLGGEAIANTLFGIYNPGGRLSVTFPKSIGQIEYNFPFKPGSHGGQYTSGPNGSGDTRVLGPLYPFGYGLSYTTFKYNNLQISQPNSGTESPVTVSVDITNTGKRTGDEVVQLYLRDKVSSVIAYESVLRGFERISLKPGETKKVVFTLQPEDLQILDRHMEWTVEPGEFEVRVGASSTDIRLRGTFTKTAF